MLFYIIVGLLHVILIVEPLPLNEMAIRHNAAMIEYCRTSISALAGSTAGILGLTGLYGFIFYFITALMMSV
jgi:ER membrane protein complex subunit 6